MKAILAIGDPALGCSAMIPSPQAVEMIEHAGFDWVLIDLDQGIRYTYTHLPKPLKSGSREFLRAANR